MARPTFARRLGLYVALTLATGCTPPWSYEAECLEEPETSSFARSVALDGELALVGNANSADLYLRPPDGSPLPPHLWVHVRRFVPRRGAPLGQFGKSVALAGNVLAIGAPWGDMVGNHGYVDIYQQGSGGVWTFLTEVTPESFDPPPQYGLELGFGEAVALQGDELFVGSHHYGDTAGRVFVFERNGNSYTQTQELKPSADAQETAFGERVRVSGNLLAISRRGPGNAGTGGGGMNTPIVPGEVHIYEKLGGGWTPAEVLVSPTSAPQDYFGTDVALDGDRLVVSEQTAVHLFERSGGSFQHLWQATLQDGHRLPLAYHPPSAGSTAYIFASDSGVVHVYGESGTGGVFNFLGNLTDPDVLPDFSTAMAHSGDILAAVTGNGTGPSRVRIFERMVPRPPMVAAVDPDVVGSLGRVQAALARDPGLATELEAAVRSDMPPRRVATLVTEATGVALDPDEVSALVLQLRTAAAPAAREPATTRR